MFNFGLFRKTWSDTFWSLLLAVAGLLGFIVLFVWAMLNMGAEVLTFVSQFPFIKKIIEMGFGISIDGEVSANVLVAISFTHGVVLSITWAVLIATTTRVTVGEFERGTADMLLTLPVSRSETFVSTTCVWILAAVILATCPLVGIWLAIQILQPEEAIEIGRFVAPTINFICLNLAIASMSMMIGTMFDRRAPAVGTIVGIVLVSVVINFLEPFLEAIKSIKFISFLNYFRPVEIARSGEWPLMSMVCLIGFAFTCWTVGVIAYSRRDIPTA